MAYRYCPECEEWYETANYTVDDHGETVCKVEDHGAVHGYIDGSIRSEDELRRRLRKSSGYRDYEAEVKAAKEQGLVT